MTAARLKLGAQALAVGLVALLLALLVWKLAKGSGKEAAIGKPAPDFTLKRVDAPGKLQLASLKGKVVVLNFWASWCQPCRDEAPIFAEELHRHAAQGLRIVGVDSQDFASDARDFAASFHAHGPIGKPV